MPQTVSHAVQSAQSVWSIPVQSVFPNPHQPRRTFEAQAIDALAMSIQQVGLLQPIAVRAVDSARYELIAGERRLRACRQLGLTHIDALVLAATEAGGALMALVENLQREDLHYLDEAEGYAAVLRDCRMTQEALAARIGGSQSAIANKVRLLRLEPSVREALRASDLSERHARELLRLPIAALQLDALGRAREEKLSVQQCEALVTSLLAALPEKSMRKKRRVISLIRDHRLYLNAIRDIVRQMQAAGLEAKADMKRREGYVEVVVRIRTEEQAPRGDARESAPQGE
ncbi:nucleoid occlusion protein [Clostridia bacterium]|nr:nucleoid occlusion protein [Clostridia bacterium]